jgi:hypothetical protein
MTPPPPCEISFRCELGHSLATRLHTKNPQQPQFPNCDLGFSYGSTALLPTAMDSGHHHCGRMQKGASGATAQGPTSSPFASTGTMPDVCVRIAKGATSHVASHHPAVTKSHQPETGSRDNVAFPTTHHRADAPSPSPSRPRTPLGRGARRADPPPPRVPHRADRSALTMPGFCSRHAQRAEV